MLPLQQDSPFRAPGASDLIVKEAQVDVRKQLNDLIRGYWITQALFVAADLNIAAHLSAGPLTPQELAMRVGALPDAIYRVLRALASIEVFREDDQGRFELTPLAETLGSSGGQAYALLHGQELYRAWGCMLETARTGTPGFNLAHGAPLFDYLAKRPERGQVFDRAMMGHHGGETTPMLDAYDFSTFSEIVDVGGGNGSLLAGTLERHARLRGVLFELPQVAGRARNEIAGAGLANRIRVVEGSFLEPNSIPRGGDAYVLRHVVHDWNDEDTIRILRHTREAASPAGRVLVVEMVIPPGNGPSFSKWLDLMMLAYGGKERTEKEYRHLFEQAGLQLNRIVDTNAGISIVEGIPNVGSAQS